MSLSPRLIASTLYIRLIPLLLCALLALSGCGDDTGNDEDTADLDDMVLDQGDGETDSTIEPKGICEPCAGPDECGGESDFCIVLGSGDNAERVCSLGCSGGDCPQGYSCLEVVPDVMQCVPDAGSCQDPCAGAACSAEELCIEGVCLPGLELCDLDCEEDAQCGGDADLCVQIPASGESICALGCEADPDVCPEGYVCAAAGNTRQCVPESLTCLDRCSTVDCPEGQICDPFSGNCRLPLQQCDLDCTISSLCGTSPLDVCVSLGASDEVICALDCSEDPTSCPSGTFCAETETGANCLPSTLTCRTDRCDGVDCPGGQVCDPVTGACVVTRGLCEGPCSNNNACLGNDDICLGFEGGETFCAQNCEDTGRCPLGYGCFAVSNGRRYCVPESLNCDFQGVACTWENRFADCAGDNFFCSATRPGEEGVCTPRCDSSSCPSSLPVCASLHLHGDICLPETPFDPATCGRLALDDNPVGRPCGNNLSPLCPAPTDVCYEPGDSGLEPFCTIECAVNADCGLGARCEAVPDGRTLCVPNACAACVAERPLAGQSDLLSQAMDNAGLSLCQLAITDDTLSTRPTQEARVPGRLPNSHVLWRRPIEGARLIQDADTALRAIGSTPVLSALDANATLSGLNLSYPQTSHTPDIIQPLADAVAQLITAGGGTPDQTALELDAADVPLPLQEQLAPVILAMADQLPRRDMAFAINLTDPAATALFEAGHGLMLRVDSSLNVPDLQNSNVLSLARDDGFDLAELAGASAELIYQLETAGLQSDSQWGQFSFNQNTPAGRIAIRGTGNDVWAAGDPDTAGPLALIVDAGGNDTYTVPTGTNTDLSQPFGIHIDLDGEDTYAYMVIADPADTGLLPSDGAGRYVPQQPLTQEDGPVSLSSVSRQGAGRFGVGILFDLGSDADRYDSLRLSQGYGQFGVGILYDDGGDDQYKLEAAGQGAGLWGLGLLVDGAGNDDYQAWHLAQSGAGPRAVASLVDLAGDDSYEAVPGESNGTGVLYFNLPDRATSNASFAQGASVGRGFNGVGDNVSIAGGVALLYDAAGFDTYLAGVYAQGTGTWHGTGILVDAGDDDQYDARRYAQGSALQYASGYLFELAGNDLYNSSILRPGIGLGIGELAAVGVLIDMMGDDEWTVSGIAGGAGIDNGIGVLADEAGLDTWTVDSGQSLGFAITDRAGTMEDDPRREALTIGVFVDGGDLDGYGPAGTLFSNIANDASWQHAGDPLVNGEKGTGTDGNGSTGLW